MHLDTQIYSERDSELPLWSHKNSFDCPARAEYRFSMACQIIVLSQNNQQKDKICNNTPEAAESTLGFIKKESIDLRNLRKGSLRRSQLIYET